MQVKDTNHQEASVDHVEILRLKVGASLVNVAPIGTVI